MKNLIFILVMLVTFNAVADDPHHEHTDTTEVTQITNIENNITIEDKSVIAMVMGQHQFDYGTYVIQKAVSAAITDDSEAISGAFAHRECKDCGLWSGSFGIGRLNNNKIEAAVAIGYTWRR